MSKPTAMLIAIAAVVMGAVGVMTKAAQDAEREAPNAKAAAAADVAPSPFKGELIVISVTGTEYGTVLTHARVEQLGDRYFITGTGYDTGHQNDWTAGAVVRVPLASVSHIAEFDKAEKYKNLAAPAQRQAPKGDL